MRPIAFYYHAKNWKHLMTGIAENVPPISILNPPYSPNQDFLSKFWPCHFFTLLTPNFMQSFRKNDKAVSKTFQDKYTDRHKKIIGIWIIKLKCFCRSSLKSLWPSVRLSQKSEKSLKGGMMTPIRGWFGLVCRCLPELKVLNLQLSLMCSISSSDVPTPSEGGARATELESSGALVERPLEWVLPLPGPSIQKTN